jgi:hypothetical protein
MPEDPFHVLHCSVGNEYSTSRHNQVNQALAKVCNELGAATVIEPLSIIFQDDRHPDLAIDTGCLGQLIDVSIRCPLSASYTRIAQHSLGVAKAAEVQKRAKYEEVINRQGSRFVPFIIESLGGWGPAAVKLALHMATHAADTTHLDRADALGLFVHTIATAVQRGNARLIIGAYQKALSRARA